MTKIPFRIPKGLQVKNGPEEGQITFHKSPSRMQLHLHSNIICPLFHHYFRNTLRHSRSARRNYNTINLPLLKTSVTAVSFSVGHEYSSPFTEALKGVLLDKELHNLYSPADGLAYLFITFVGCLSTPRALEVAFPSIRMAMFLSSSIFVTTPRLLISKIDGNLLC